jgi:hypothetical protein
MNYYKGTFKIAGVEQTIYYSLYKWQTNHLNGKKCGKRTFDLETKKL